MAASTALNRRPSPTTRSFFENYEVGFKSEFGGGRFRLNGAYFYMDYKDKQEEIGLKSDGATGQRISVFNAATATMKGIELQGQALVSEGLTLALISVTSTRNMTSSPLIRGSALSITAVSNSGVPRSTPAPYPEPMNGIWREAKLGFAVPSVSLTTYS